MNILVGHTGFVGSNLYSTGIFDAAYNSKNIEDAYGTNPNLLIYCGLPAEKYLANCAPEKDYERILQAEKNITKINPQKVVLISTIDVFDIPINVNENSLISTKNIHAYGYNRYLLESWTRVQYPDALIIRLPGLFGRNIKKNFIYDMIHIIPTMLKKEKLEELSNIDADITNYYSLWDTGFYKLKELSKEDQNNLKTKFTKMGFSAVNFTDSRSIYQFYNLGRLWKDLQVVLNAGILLWHPATEPISAGELYLHLTGKTFENILDSPPAHYDYKTIYDSLFQGKNGYICSKEEVIDDIKKFMAVVKR